MTEPAPAGVDAPLAGALPPRTRLLHIGVPKSGTTYMQRAAAKNRTRLLEHGVRYPGTAISHRLPILALMGEELGWGSSATPPDRARWDRLMDEIEGDTARRCYISNEAASLSDDEQARRFVDALGPQMQVLITLRGFSQLLSSTWQQRVKTGHRHSFDRWLQAVLADERSGIGVADYKRVDLAGVVNRWSELVGPDRVTVIVADKNRPTLLTDALCDLLDVPRAVLDMTGASGYSANRGLSLPEVEMIRALNGIVRAHGRTDWAQYTMLVRNGATARMLQMRAPGPKEPPVLLPRWAAEAAAPIARMHADTVLASGCRIIGDVDSLCAPVATVEKVPKVNQVPIRVAAEAVAGAVSAATGRRAFFGADPEQAVDSEGAATVAEALGGMRSSKGGGKVWDGPAVRRGIQIDPAWSRGALARTLGKERAVRLNTGYVTTKHIPPGRLLAIALLRMWRSKGRRSR